MPWLLRVLDQLLPQCGLEDRQVFFWVFYLSMSITFQELMVSINSLWSSGTMWWHRSGSTLVRVMAFCRTSPSHYLNHCWLIIRGVLWHSPERNFAKKMLMNLIHNACPNITLQVNYHMGLLPDMLNCGLRMRRECRERFSSPSRVSDPDMHHGTCVTHVPGCMPGSLTSDFLWNR